MVAKVFIEESSSKRRCGPLRENSDDIRHPAARLPFFYAGNPEPRERTVDDRDRFLVSYRSQRLRDVQAPVLRVVLP